MTDDQASRRSFLGRLLAGTVLAGMAGAVGSVLAFLLPPAEVRSTLGPRRVRVGGAADLPQGRGKLTLVDNEAVWILHLPSGFVALSASCTHKGCLLNWEEKRRLFVCPCHNGRFDESGNVVSGMPRLPLSRFRVASVGGDLYVSRGEDERI